MLVSGAFGLAGIGLVGYAVGSLRRATRSKKWPSVDGEVLKSTLQTTPDLYMRHLYRADMQYRYSVDGKVYTGSRVAFGDRVATGAKKAVTNRLTAFSVGDLIRVSYNPTNHQEAVLTTAPAPEVWQTILVGIVFIAGSVVAIIELIKASVQ